MPKRTYITATVAATLCLTSHAASAQLGSIRTANGVTSAISSVGSGLGKKLFAKDKRVDIEAEREKFFGNIDAQTAGMDPAQRQQLMGKMEQQWASIESSLLIANMQATREKNAPLLNVKQLALDVAEATVLDSQIGAITGGSTEILSASAIQGVVEGLGGDTSPTPTVWSMGTPMGIGGMSVGDVASSAASSTVAGGVQEVTAELVKKMTTQSESASYAKIELGDEIDPLEFLGKHPSAILPKDLYREIGFIGWKRVELNDATEIYAPVIGDKLIRASVYQTDLASGRIVSAFRVLNGTALSFGPLVDQISAKHKLTARYASSGDSLRAVWPNGVFLTADTKQMYLGWSEQARQIAEEAATQPASGSGS